MPAPNQPTLLYPVGGEQIDASYITIRWDEPADAATTASHVELRAAQGMDIFDDERSYVIGRTVPGVKSFVWNINSSISGFGMRISVRLVAPDGSRSASSVSYDNFNIISRVIPAPVVVEPKPSASIAHSALIVFDNTPYDQMGASKLQYFVYASSEHAQSFYLKVAENIPVGTSTFLWDVEEMRNSSDWYLNIYVADDSGKRSPTINIGPLSIGDPGFILFDTEPPEIKVQLQQGDFYTKKRDISLKVYADDEGTNIHAMQVKEFIRVWNGSAYEYRPPGDGVNDIIPLATSYYVDNTYRLYDQDIRKYIGIFAQDYGANRNDLSDARDFFTTKKPSLFREFVRLGNNQFFRSIQFFSDGEPLYLDNDATAGLGIPLDDGTYFLAVISSSESKIDSVVKIGRYFGVSTLLEVDMPVITLGKLGNSIFVSLGNNTRTMDVREIVTNRLEPKFSNDSFGTEVTSIGSDGFNNLFMGCADGRLFVKSGATLSLVGQLAGTVTSIIKANSGAALVCAGNSNNIYTASPTGVTALEVTI